MVASSNFVRSSSNYIRAGGLFDLRDNSFTLAAWINSDSIASYSYQGLMANWNGGGSPMMGLRNTGVVAFWRGGARGGWLNGGSISDGTWYFVAITFDGGSGSGTPRVYSGTDPSDFALDNSGSSVDFPAGTTDTEISIGAYWSSDLSNGYDGQLAHAHMYNRALSLEELKQIMAVPGSIQNGLEGYYPMFTTSPLVDLSGNGNDATQTGSLGTSTDGPPVHFPKNAPGV